MEQAGVGALPRVKYGNREYFTDERLREFRSVSYPPQTVEFVPFDSAKERRMLATLLSDEEDAPPRGGLAKPAR